MKQLYRVRVPSFETVVYSEQSQVTSIVVDNIEEIVQTELRHHGSFASSPIRTHAELPTGWGKGTYPWINGGPDQTISDILKHGDAIFSEYDLVFEPNPRVAKEYQITWNRRDTATVLVRFEPSGNGYDPILVSEHAFNYHDYGMLWKVIRRATEHLNP